MFLRIRELDDLLEVYFSKHYSPLYCILCTSINVHGLKAWNQCCTQKFSMRSLTFTLTFSLLPKRAKSSSITKVTGLLFVRWVFFGITWFFVTSHKACFMICKSVIALITWLSPSKVTIDIFHRYYRRFVDESSIHFITNLNDTMVRRPPQAWQVSLRTWVWAYIHYFPTKTILTRCYQKNHAISLENLTILTMLKSVPFT